MPRSDLISYQKKVSYHKHPGTIAWLLHRVTGVVIGFYLIFHILATTGVLGWFNSVSGNQWVKAFILLTILFHAFNGVRIIVVDFFTGYDKTLFFKQVMAVTFLVIIVFAIGVIPIFVS